MSSHASMTQNTDPSRAVVTTVFRVLVTFDTVALFFAAALHIQGARIPLGAAVFVEPQIVPAAIVEGVAGILFAVAAYAVLGGRRWAWTMTVVAHAFAILGFLVGIAATLAGTSPFNRVYHIVMLCVFLIGLALLLTPGARAALGRGGRMLRSV